MDEGDEACHGISRQPDQRGAIDNPHRDGPAGLDRHAPQDERTNAFDASLDVILFPGRNAAGGKDQVAGGGRLLQRVCERETLIAQNAEIADQAAEPLEHRHQHEAVGIKQLCCGARRARRRQLIAGRKHSDANASRHFEFGQAERGGQRDILRPQALAGLQRDMA